MADRMHPYPMFPQSLTPNSLQQPQIPQQPPQSQQPDPQMISALSNPEPSRMWQMNQLQNPYHPQQSGDLTASQMNHQMQEFARGQALSHGQGQPMIQQSFGLNAQRMNPGPVFHDPQANLSQLLMSSNSSNVPMNTQQQMKSAFNMNSVMHSGVPRQLKMLNQQEVVRLQQSGLGAQHAPNQPSAVDMFASSSMQASQDQMHSSPHPAAQPIGPSGSTQAMAPGNQQPSTQKRMMTPTEFQERRNYLLSMISQSETNMASLLQTARSSSSIDLLMQQKLHQLRTELTSRKEVYTNFVATYGAMVTQQMANGIPPSNMPHTNPMAHSTSQQPQQPTASNSQVQPGFVTSTNQPVAQYNIPATNGSSPMPAQSQGALNQQIPIATTQVGRPNTIPPRSGGTPHQIAGSQLPNTMSPNLGNFVPQGGQKISNPNQTRVLPLDKQRFDSAYAHFCRCVKMQPNLRVPIGDNRMVDLHQLHVYVMHEGGASEVTLRDLWAVIGGRLGFVQFPGNDSEPARSGPGIAQQIHNTYEQCLQNFENAYIVTVKNRTATGSPQQPINQMNLNPLAIGNNATSSMSGNATEMAPHPPRSVINQQLIWAAARYAHTSAQDMRAQRVREEMISFVDRHRPDLMRVYQQQMQQTAKRNAEQEQQNPTNAPGQLPKVSEQASIGLQPGIQRHHQPMGANTVVGMSSGDAKMDQVQHAMMAISHLKNVFQQRSLPGMNTHQIADEQRLEYNQLLEQVYKMTSELDGRLHMYFAVFKSEDLLRKYVAIVMTVARQRQLLSTSSPQYIIPLENLRNMQLQILKLNEEFENRCRVMKASTANSHPHASLASTPARLKNPPSPHTAPPIQHTSQIALPVPPSNGRQVSVNPSPQQTHLQPPPSHTHLHPPPHTQTQPQQQSMSQPIKKRFHSIPPSPSAAPTIASLASPTPPPAAASSSTPVTSAPTPQTAAGSPQTPKSPPSKVSAKSKATTRITRKMSTAGKRPATPETTSSVAGVKRPPEEDVSTFTSVAPLEAEATNAPSPKKAKTEWEGETSEALLKKQQELENIKTEDDTAAFFNRVKELLAMTTGNEVHHDIASTLDQILAGVAQEPADVAATAAALSVHGAGDAGPPPTALSPHIGPANDAFLEFIDFSTLDEEDSDSKAPTPDLVPSETNLSPESGSEGDSLGSTGSPDKIKIEESAERSDPLRLGSLREIDGGESAYYQADNWKWEGTMHTLEQPWAIFTS